jgi:MFS family permease
MKVNTAIMGNWWPAKGRGLIFGLWTCHQYIGDIVAALAAGFLLHSGFDYRWYRTEHFQLCILLHTTPPLFPFFKHPTLHILIFDEEFY